MSSVHFVHEIDMNGLKITELAPGTAGTDAVNVNQLSTNAPQGFAADIGDGVALSYDVTHNLDTLDVLVQVVQKSDNQTVNPAVRRLDVDTVRVTFTLPPLLNSHRVLIVPVP